MKRQNSSNIKTRSKSNKKSVDKIFKICNDDSLNLKPTSPYQLWSAEERIKLKDEKYAKLENKFILTELGLRWKQLDDTEKDKWKDIAEEKRKNFLDEMKLILSEGGENSKKIISEEKNKNGKRSYKQANKNEKSKEKTKRKKKTPKE